MALQFRALRASDEDALFAFEIANREWFERHIEGRGDAFYTRDGLREHIDFYLQSQRRREMFPGLLFTEDARLVGRANLRNIDMQRHRGEIGYRIAEADCGQGYAVIAVGYLKAIARDVWHLRSLCAHITTENLASQQVMKKCGFLLEGVQTGRVEVAGVMRDSFRYVCALGGSE